MRFKVSSRFFSSEFFDIEMKNPTFGRYGWPYTILGKELPKQIPHAIGTISINWNWCDFILDHFLGHYLSELPGPISAIVIQPLQNVTKREILIALIAKREEDETIKDLMSHFLKCFETCRENRNLLTHSLCVLEHTASEYIAFESARLQASSIRSRVIPAKAAPLRQAARDTKNLFNYGVKVADYIRLKPRIGLRATLPKKPPLPDKLSLLHPVLKGE